MVRPAHPILQRAVAKLDIGPDSLFEARVFQYLVFAAKALVEP
jgi:hypothetical protein